MVSAARTCTVRIFHLICTPILADISLLLTVWLLSYLATRSNWSSKLDSNQQLGPYKEPTLPLSYWRIEGLTHTHNDTNFWRRWLRFCHILCQSSLDKSVRLGSFDFSPTSNPVEDQSSISCRTLEEPSVWRGRPILYIAFATQSVKNSFGLDLILFGCHRFHKIVGEAG